MEVQFRIASAQRGDVICVSRPPIVHYEVYINDNRVIHFAPKDNDLFNVCIHAVSMLDFLKGQPYYVVKYPVVIYKVCWRGKDNRGIKRYYMES
jgi:hypothetical protein